MSANKIILNGDTLIDLTQDTATESDVVSGKTFHKANGERVVGTATLGSGETIVTGSVNGTEVKQIVAAGKTINKGDFVELVNGGTSFSLVSLGVSITANNGFYLLDENTLILFEKRNVYAFEFVNTVWQLLYKTSISLKGNSEGQISTCRITDNKFVVLSGNHYSDGTGSDKSLFMSVVEVTKTSAEIILSNVEVYTATYNGIYLSIFGEPYIIDDTHVLLSTTKIRSWSPDYPTSIMQIYEFAEDYTSCVKLSESTTCSETPRVWKISEHQFVRSCGTSSETNSIVEVWDINNYVLTKNRSETLDGIFSYGMVFNNNFYLSNKYVAKIENGEVGSFNSTSFVAVTHVLSDKLYLHAAKNNIQILLCGEDMKSLYSLPITHYIASNTTTLVASSNSIYFHDVVGNTIVNYRITDDNKIVINEEVGSKVQPAKSALYLYGIALESGTGGQEIRIAIPSAATPSVLITFTIDGTTYQAEEGMTWSEWVESSYNTGGYYVGYYGIHINEDHTIHTERGEAITSVSETIVVNENYTIGSYMASN